MTKQTLRLIVMVWMLIASVAVSVYAAEPLEYNRDIRPILADNCFACHGADSASRKADLRLDQRDAAVDFGAIEPGKPEDSELVARIFSDDPEAIMPPHETKKSLTAGQKDLLKRWIADGAEYQLHWSFIAPTKRELPTVNNADWSKNEIDRFVLARLEQAGLSPAPAADARTMFRRLHLDITGLPPSPEEMTQFVSDYAADNDAALSQWIDKLMSTPAWGEHRARYWLDAARYADTHGLHFDNYREMWPYRDWVIRAFNANQPYDQFTIEQLAGDLLPEPTEDQLIATGFQRCNITTNEGGTIAEENLANYAVDRVQTFGWVYLGLTTNCAQCHDHKFDPISQKDYYSLAAFFRNTTQGALDGNVKDGRGPVINVPMPEDRPRWDALPGEIATASKALADYRQKADGPFQTWLANTTPETLDEQVSTDKLIAHLPLHDKSSKPEFATGELSWVDDGKLGAAPVIKAGSTFDLGELGDFERDHPFSYGCWVKPVNNSTSAGIIARMDEQAKHRGWDLWQNGNGYSVHIIDSWPDNAFKVTTKQPIVKAGQWQHLLATYDGSGKPEGVKIYVDGESQPLNVDTNALKPDASIRTTTPLRVGQRSQTAIFAGGAVQDVRLYSRLLSSDEVKSIASNAALRTMLGTPTDKRTPQQKAALLDHYLQHEDANYPPLAQAVVTLEAELETIRARSPVTHIQKEKMNSPAMAHVLTRGEYDRPTDEVPATTPAALHAFDKAAPGNRLNLARWVVSPDNALTSRVTVNRFWSQVFGRGLVVTTEDFGVMGDLPSHPELLDWLAIDFRDNGWNVQRLFKQMLMSATYRQSAALTPEKLERDRDNELFSRGPRFRMDAEMIRDHALATSGLLAAKMYGPSVKPYQPEALWDVVGLPSGNTRNYEQSHGEDLYRRSLYTFWKRMSPPPGLEAFNAPSREVCTVRRERTNTPLQALVTLNDPQFVEAARYLAQTMVKESAGDAAVAISAIGQCLLGRDFNTQEQQIILANQADYLSYYQAHPDDAAALIKVGETPADDSIEAPLLAAWTMTCNQLMNLDEVLTK